MIVSKKWLQDFIEEPLPETEKLVEGIIMHVFEVENVEKVGDDEVFDIKVLPDRNHYALSHRGIAKEVSAIFGLTFKDIVPKKEFSDSKKLEVKIEDEKLCRRYMALRIENVKVGESPSWLKERLEAVGQKSINNIVDATNYTMFSFGQPLHAFDADKVEGALVARAGRVGESLDVLNTKSLDTKDRVIELGRGECVIADDSGPLVLAGIKGGAKTAISSGTKNIILESANFNPVVTRKFSTLYNLRSETSKRFENEITPEYASDGLKMCADLILQIAGGEVEGAKDVYPKTFPTYKVGVSGSDIQKLLGVEVGDSEIENIFKKIGFSFEKVVPVEKALSLKDTVLGAPYKYGVSVAWDSPSAFDCSSLTSWLFVQGGVSLPRVSIDQYFFTERIEKENLKAGDLVFSNSHNGNIYTEAKEFMAGEKFEKGIDHVGLYLGEDKILHATRAQGKVVIENLTQSEQFKDVVAYGRVKGGDTERFVVSAPKERFDIRIKEDLIEEVGRVYGYEHIVSRKPKVDTEQITDKKYVVETIVRETLVSQGFSEVFSYAFRKKGDIELANAYTSEKSHLRDNLTEPIREALEENARYADLLGLSKIKIFEIGNVFKKEGEETRLCIGVSFAKKFKGDTPETEIEKIISEILSALQITSLKNSPSVKDGVVEINMRELTDLAGEGLCLPAYKSNEIKKYEAVSQYPFVVRDIALWVLGENAENEIEKIIKNESGMLLKRLTKFDTFSKDGKTSYAYRLVLQSMEKTLEEGEINKIMQSITEKLNVKEGWEVR